MKNVEDIYPLSPLQEGMLFHSLKESASGAYHEQYYCRLNGDFDPSVYRQAWQSVIDRHTALRTAFLWEGLDQPVQVVRGNVSLDWVEQELEDTAKKNYDEWLQTYLNVDRSRVFDLSKAPLMRFRLFRIDANTYQWIWSYHHIISDGWSTAIILDEVDQAYRNLHIGSQADYPAKPKAYREFIAWLQNRNLDAARNYWKERFKGFTSPTPIPLRRPAHAMEGYQQIEQTLQPDKLVDLEAIAKTQRVTLNTVIQGAWAILLYRYAGVSDIVFGSTVSGRPATMDGIQDMVGLFINTLPVRIIVDSQMPFSQMLANLQSSEIEARNFEYSPLSKVQTWSGLPRGTQLFDTIVVSKNHPRQYATDRPEIGLEFSHVNYKAHSNYPLALIVIPDQELRLILVYDRSRFIEVDIHRIFGHLKAILRSFTDQPHRLIKDISVMTDQEKQMAAQWQKGPIRDQEHPLVHLHIETQASSQPNATAVVYQQQELSYKDFNQQANQLAHMLIERPQVSGTRVGIYVHRSVEMMIAILAVIKSGAAYIPLDPTYPPKRIAHMMADSGITHILTTHHLVEALPDTSAEIIFLEDKLNLESQSQNGNPDRTIRPEDLAYIIYTSGSSGLPKGVMINHSNLAHSTGARKRYYQQKPRRFLLLSSISFDSSVAGIFGTLCQGGCLFLPDQSHYRDIDYLTALIDEQEITHMLCIPSLYQHMLLFYETRLSSLESVIVAGEPCPADLTAQHFSALPQTDLFNEYGPSEGTVWSTVYRCRPDDTPGPTPIGRPIENAHIRILDADLQPTPPIIPGEVYIGGPGIFQGYIDQPEVTSKQLIDLSENPYHPEKFYKTGDQAYFRCDGNVIYCGRIDRQVKIRGYRIELGEIESIIAEHPDVKESAVVLGNDLRRKERLVAYVGSSTDRKEMIPALQKYLRSTIPEYMIPSIIIAMDRLPRTMNGKIDRNALPGPNDNNQDTEEAYVAPRSDLEEALATIWSTLLGVEKVGIKDNFFKLGGDSLSAIRLISNIKNNTKNDIPISVLFNNPTIEEMSDYVNYEQLPRSNSSIVPYQSRGHKIPLFSTFNSRAGLQNFLEKDQPLYKFLTYYDEIPIPNKLDSIETIAENYIKDLKKDFKSGPYTLCGYSAGGMIVTEMAKQLAAHHNEYVFLFLLEPTWPSNVELSGSYKISPIKKKIDRITRILSAIRENPVRAMVFIAEKLRYKFYQNFHKLYRYPLYLILRRFNFKIPYSWRLKYAGRLYVDSTREYMAKPYNGPVTICLTQKSHAVDQADWSKIYKNIVNFHLIPEAKDHHDLIHNAKSVKVWARYLSRFLTNINKVN